MQKIIFKKFLKEIKEIAVVVLVFAAALAAAELAFKKVRMKVYEVGLRKDWVKKMKKFPIKNLIKLSVVSIVAIVGLFVFSNGAEAA